MKRTFIELPLFTKKWKALGLNDSDLHRLQLELLTNTQVGAIIRGTGGVRKMRFAFEDKGKRGSARVIYVDFAVYESIFLITAYKKGEKDNLEEGEKKEIKQLIKILENQLKQNRKVN